MAGEGRRFIEQGYKILKPLIEVDGRMILEWTLDSLPLKTVEHRLFFAVKSEHCEKYPIVEKISEKFPDANFIFLDGKQLGNMFSSYKAYEELGAGRDSTPLLFLDSDNHYDGSLFFEFLKFVGPRAKNPQKFAATVAFKPLDDSAKWGFVIPGASKYEAKTFMEKDPQALKLGGLPMMGCFYFSTGYFFRTYAESILQVPQEGEYYMTQALKTMVGAGEEVLNFITPRVAPLGTPEDVKAFEGPYWIH